MEVETIADIVEGALSGVIDYAVMARSMSFAALSDLGEVFIRTPGGQYFKMVIEPVSADDVEGWGIEFDA